MVMLLLVTFEKGFFMLANLTLISGICSAGFCCCCVRCFVVDLNRGIRIRIIFQKILLQYIYIIDTDAALPLCCVAVFCVSCFNVCVLCVFSVCSVWCGTYMKLEA